MNLTIKIVDDDTLCVTDGWITDYIRLTGDPDRPWFYIDEHYLPLTPVIREAVDQFAKFRISKENQEREQIAHDRWVIEHNTGE